MTRSYISIGSNIDREHNVASSLQALSAEFGELEQSKTWETEAVGFDGDPFYNLVVALDTELSAQELATSLRRIEDRHGRDRSSGKFSGRTLDLDLLLHGDQVLNEAHLKLPRAEILEYAFVLKPLAEIAGGLKHPVTGVCFSSLWEAFDADSQPMWPVKQ